MLVGLVGALQQSGCRQAGVHLIGITPQTGAKSWAAEAKGVEGDREVKLLGSEATQQYSRSRAATDRLCSECASKQQMQRDGVYALCCTLSTQSGWV